MGLQEPQTGEEFKSLFLAARSIRGERPRFATLEATAALPTTRYVLSRDRTVGRALRDSLLPPGLRSVNREGDGDLVVRGWITWQSQVGTPFRRDARQNVLQNSRRSRTVS